MHGARLLATRPFAGISQILSSANVLARSVALAEKLIGRSPSTLAKLRRVNAESSFSALKSSELPCSMPSAIWRIFAREYAVSLAVSCLPVRDEAAATRL